MVAFDGLQELDKLNELALPKYDMHYLEPVLQNHVQNYMERHCVAVFAIASRYGWGDMAKAAAKQSLPLNLRTLVNNISSKPSSSTSRPTSCSDTTTLARMLRRLRGGFFRGQTLNISGSDAIAVCLIPWSGPSQDSPVASSPGPGFFTILTRRGRC
jgi:hypothetical protein